MQRVSRRTSQLVEVPGLDLRLAVRVNRRAKRISLRVDAVSDVATLVLPSEADWADGVRFARSRERWLKKQLARRPARVPFADGSIIPFHGEPHEIVHSDEACGGVWQGDGTLLIGGTAVGLSGRLQSWLRHRARLSLSAHAERYAAELGRPIRRIAIRDPKSQWGSCTRSGNLSFSWRLVMAPAYVLDYMAAHEVTHLAEFGHGPGFRRTVRALCPHVAKAERWLAQRGHDLHRYG